jgi:uncharacterized membrane protein YphA (DoxX/SURF4 family)
VEVFLVSACVVFCSALFFLTRIITKSVIIRNGNLLKENKIMDIALWIVQSLLALAFLAAGVMKTFSPLDKLGAQMPWVKRWPAGMVRFIGIAELLAGIGLILPAATHILPWLTIAAAVGLVLVMILAAIEHTRHREFSGIGANVVLLLLAAFVVLGRMALAPF